MDREQSTGVALKRDDLKSNQNQLMVVCNLLMYCCTIRKNRGSLLRLGALGLLLEMARRAFSVDVMETAEGVLLIVEFNLYVTYGERAAMETLVQYFDLYLQNWSEFARHD
ncbi:hypothetical protein POM88_028720 [Heracleum sosnowskyi]|uniref:E3 ubiquitin ligase UBR4 C-terminal domain-containing protein n=1 Tax=Heracleum sosnowskyi TaxID=360622 RepID=A0AAD8MGZ8_9APIA|nr:hypothetical protein POM88_028720 [Heracleum sosnowskyi]